MKLFEQRLQGGHFNSLGNTVEIVEEVLQEPGAFDELFHCYFSEDATVRMRTSNAMKRIAAANKGLLLPYLNRMLDEIADIDQASTQWTLAQLFLDLQNDLSPQQIAKARAIMVHNLAQHSDWIVLNMTMKTLGTWVKKDPQLRQEIYPSVERLQSDKRNSVAKSASKLMAILEG